MDMPSEQMPDELIREETVSTMATGKAARPIRKRHRVFGEKICQVCGDKALAHHFGTLACETCKAFFRRNALVKEQRKCLFTGECPITVKTRRFCPACRLKKCFDVGMRTDLILDEEEKKERLQKIKEKQSRKGQQMSPYADPSQMASDPAQIPSPACSVTTSGRDLPYSPEQAGGLVEQAWRSASEMSAAEVMVMKTPSPFPPSSQWSSEEKRLGVGVSSGVEVVVASPQSISEDSKTAVFPSSQSHGVAGFSCPPTPSTPVSPVVSPPGALRSELTSPPSLPPPASQPQDLSIHAMPSPSLVAQSQLISSFQHVSRDAMPSDPYMYWRLSEEERCLLTQLSSAYQDTLLSVLQARPPRESIRNELITPEGYLQECEREARQAINFAKRMEDFRQLRTDEQIALLKASTNQVLGLRGCALYILEKNAWLTHKGYFTMEHCNILCPDYPLKDLVLTFCRTVKSIVKNDVTLYALLHCVILFDPCDERVIDRQLINSIRDKYIILLRHYLQSVYSFGHSEKYFMALQENLIFYRQLVQEGRPLIRKFFPSIPNKLLVEIMDLD